MQLKLKQINLLYKSNREGNLKLSLQHSGSPTVFDSDNIYEFILESTGKVGIMSTNLLAVALYHRAGALDESLLRFIAKKMICEGQPSLTFKVDVVVDLYISPNNNPNYHALYVQTNISEDLWFETTHYEYGTPILGHIDYLADRTWDRYYKDRVFTIQGDSASAKDDSKNVYGSFAWSIPIQPQGTSIETTLNLAKQTKILFAKNERESRNTEKYSSETNRLIVTVSGISNPINSDSTQGLENNLYYIDKIKDYLALKQTALSINESKELGQQLWWACYNFFKEDRKSWLGGYLYPLVNAEGVIGNNSYGELECAALYTNTRDDFIWTFNLGQSLVRSTYTFVDHQGVEKIVPYCTTTLSNTSAVYNSIETSFLFYKSLTHIVNLHEQYRKDNQVVTTQEKLDKGMNIPTEIINDEDIDNTDTDNTGNPVNHVNDPSLYSTGMVAMTDEFKAMEERLNKLDYTLIQYDGEYYATPKSFAIMIPYKDDANGINIAAGDTYKAVCEAFQMNDLDFCRANGWNDLKYNHEDQVYIGQVLKIPTDKREYLKVSDAALMAMSSPTFKVSNSNYVPAESAFENYETLTIDDRDVLDGVIRHDQGKVDPKTGDDIYYSPFGKHMLRIGDCTLPISPLSITTMKTSQSERVSTLRTRNSMQTKSGYSTEVLTISLYFNGHTQINGYSYQPYEDDPELIYYRNGLRPLIAQFMKAPFLPIENELINHTYGIYSVCLQDIQLNSIPEFPHCMEVTLTLLPFDHSTYMFNEEFFEGAFCWPLFRWYYQQKMIKEGSTQLKPYVGNDMQLFTHKIDMEGHTEDILFNPANTLIFSIPKEGALKQRKKAIHELWNKKAPAIFEQEQEKLWIGSDTPDGYKLNLAYQQYKNFTVVKNYYPQADYPDLYTVVNTDQEQQSQRGNNSDFQITFFDVGQGDAALIECDGKTMLIDGGNPVDENYPKDKVSLSDHFKSKNITHIDVVICTHAHLDHYGGLIQIIKDFSIGKIYTPNYSDVKQLLETSTYQAFIDAIEKSNVNTSFLNKDDVFELGSANVAVFGPTKPALQYMDVEAGKQTNGKESLDWNHTSIVLKVSYGNTSFLFMGDAEGPSEKDLLESGKDLHATVLKVGHHGSNSSSREDFLQAVSPECAIISVGENTYGHPTEETIGRLRDSGADIYQTDQVGDIVVKSNGQIIVVNGSFDQEGTEETNVKRAYADSTLKTIFTLEKIGEIINQFKESGDQIASVNPETKYTIVNALADFLTIYTSTYQYARYHYFMPNGFRPKTVFAVFELLKQNLDALVYTGNESSEWKFKGFNANKYKNAVDTLKSMKVVYGTRTDTVDAQDAMDGVSATVGVLGGVALAAGITIGIVTGVGALALILGISGAATIITDVALNTTDGAIKQDLMKGIEFKGIDSIFGQLYFCDQKSNIGIQIEWPTSRLGLQAPDGSACVVLDDVNNIDHLIQNGWGVQDRIYGGCYEIAPNAIPMLEGGFDVDTTKAEVEAYKEEMENLRWLAHQTESDIPTKTITLADIVVQSCTASLSNKFVPLQTQKLEGPTYQFLGGSDITMRLAFVTKSRAALKSLMQAMKESQYLAREYRIAITNGILDFHHPFFSLLGAKSALVENIAIETSDESAETFNVVIDIISFDKTQKQRETLNKDGFGMVFDDKQDWTTYQKLKRSNSDFEYSNVDLMLKEAELYPDLELPTYEEVNQFLSKHPIIDKYGVKFDYFVNHTNCKYVDPDFYLRCEETVRDFIETKLNKGRNDGSMTGAILHDKYDNAILSTCPSATDQFSVKDGDIEIGGEEQPPGFIENDICNQNIRQSMSAMIAMSAMGEVEEQSAAAYYTAVNSNPFKDQKQSAEEKERGDKLAAELRETIDLVTDISSGGRIGYFVTDEGTHFDVDKYRKIVTLDFSLIAPLLNRLVKSEKAKDKDFAETIKKLKDQTLKLVVIDTGADQKWMRRGITKGSLLETIKNSQGHNDALESKKTWVYSDMEVIDTGRRERESKVRYRISDYKFLAGITPGGAGSFLVTLITLYVFVHFYSQDNIGSLLSQDGLSQYYMILDPSHSDYLQHAFDKTITYGSSLKKYWYTAVDGREKEAPYCTDLFHYVWNLVDDECTPSEILYSRFNMRQVFESNMIYFYQKGNESLHFNAGLDLLEEIMTPYKNGLNKTSSDGIYVNSEMEVEDGRDKSVEEFVQATTNWISSHNVPSTLWYPENLLVWGDFVSRVNEVVFKRRRFGTESSNDMGVWCYEYGKPERPESPEESLYWAATEFTGTKINNLRVYDFLNHMEDGQFNFFRYRLDFSWSGLNSILDTSSKYTAIICDQALQEMVNVENQSRLMMVNLALYSAIVFFAGHLCVWAETRKLWTPTAGFADNQKIFNYNKETKTITPIMKMYVYADTGNSIVDRFLRTPDPELVELALELGSIPWSLFDDPNGIWDQTNTGDVITYRDKVTSMIERSNAIVDKFAQNNIYYNSSYRMAELYMPETATDPVTGQVTKVADGMALVLQSANDRLNSNLNVMHQQHLFRTSFNDLLKYDCRGRLIRAFPSFHMTIIDEGDQGLFYSMWDNFYAYNSIVSIDVYKDRRIVADTALIQMTNLYHNLSSKDTDFIYDDYDYTFFDAIKFGATEESRGYWTKQWSLWFNLPDATLMKAQQEKVSSIVLSPGARIHLRMGYGSDAYSLPIVFNGVITEVSAEELMTIAAQGDGVELSNKLQVSTKDTTDPGAFEAPLEPRMIIGDMMTNRGSFFRNVVNKISNNTLYQPNPLGIAHFGQNEEVSSMVAWENSPIIFGWWSRITNHETETNNYGPSLLNVYAGGAARSLSKWSYTDLSGRNENFSGESFAWKWNVVNMFTGEKEVNEIPQARIYLFDMSVNDVCQMLAACCPDYICAVTPFELRSTLFFGRPSWGYAKEYLNMYKWDGQLKQLVKQRAGYSRQSFAQTRFYNSYTDIISNKISASSEYMKTNIIGVYNEKNGAKQTATVQIDSDLDDDCQTTGTVHLPLKADMAVYNYFHQGKLAEIAAISELRNQAGHMYQGDLVVLGDPSVKPHDKMYIQDSYVDMHGMVGVRTVHHELSIDTGLISTIAPDLISVHDDPQELEGLMWKSQVAAEVVAAVSTLAFTKLGWKMFLNGPIAERVKQLGMASVKNVMRNMLANYAEDGVAQSLLELGNADDLIKALNVDNEAIALTNMEEYAKNLPRYVQDRWEITKVFSVHGDDIADAKITGLLKHALGENAKLYMNPDGTFDLAKISKMVMSEDEITRLHAVLNTSSSKIDDTLKAGFKTISDLTQDIENFGSSKFKSMGIKDKKAIKLSKKQTESLEGIIKKLDDIGDKELAQLKAILESAQKENVVDGEDLMRLLRRGKRIKARKIVDGTTIDVAKIGAKNGDEVLDTLVDVCKKFGKNWNGNAAVKLMDSAGLKAAIKNSRKANKVGDVFKHFFGKAKNAPGIGKALNKFDDVKDVVKVGKSITGTLRTLGSKIGTAIAPGMGTIIGIAADIAFEILTEMAFDFYFRWKRRRQALILMPMIYRGHSFIAGLDGHKGAVLGDSPGVIDTVLMGQGICSGMFNLLNAVTGSDIDYSNASLSEAYNEWQTQVTAWNDDFTYEDLDGLGIEELDQGNTDE